MLSQEQLLHYETFGFVVMPHAFVPDEVAHLKDEFLRGLEQAYHHMPFDGSCRHWTTMMGPETPFFGSLLEDERFCGVAEQLYGADVFGVAADANRYVGDTSWHPDTATVHQYGVKFAYYLQPVGADSGALRVVPGSHRDPLHGNLRRHLPELELAIQAVPAHVCAADPGDVIAFDLRIWHASFGGSEDRWMCTIVYYNNPTNVEEEEATRRQLVSNTKTTASYHRPEDPLSDPSWWANSNHCPKRGRWIHRMRELGVTDPRLFPPT